MPKLRKGLMVWCLVLAGGAASAWADCASDRDCGEGVSCRSAKCASSGR